MEDVHTHPTRRDCLIIEYPVHTMEDVHSHPTRRDCLIIEYPVHTLKTALTRPSVSSRLSPLNG